MDDKHTFRSRHGPLDQPWDDTNGKDGTHADQEDMKRMGKTQDLHVRPEGRLNVLALIFSTEKFPVHIYLWLFDGHDGVVGVTSHVSFPWQTKSRIDFLT